MVDHTPYVTLIVGALFSLPMYAGYGAHWPLGDAEKAALSKDLMAVFDTMPASAHKRFLALLGKFGPYLALMMTVGAITVPRVMVSNMLLQGQQPGTVPPVGPAPVASPSPSVPAEPTASVPDAATEDPTVLAFRPPQSLVSE